MLYSNPSFIYIHIESVVCHMLAGVVTDTEQPRHFLSEAAEHVHLFYVLSDEIRKKPEQLLLGLWLNAGLTPSPLLLQSDVREPQTGSA